MMLHQQQGLKSRLLCSDHQGEENFPDQGTILTDLTHGAAQEDELQQQNQCKYLARTFLAGNSFLSSGPSLSPSFQDPGTGSFQ